jgi:hypothetical protein
MKRGDYLTEKEEKKRPTVEGIVLLAVFVVIFLAVIFRFAIRTGTNEGFFSFMPTKAQAYLVSTAFVRPTVTIRGDVSFPDHDFQFSKDADSIYVIKSFYVIDDSEGHSAKKNFTITLKYLGGARTDGRNWKMIGLQQDK